MIQVLAFTIFLLLLARAVGAPRGAWKVIAGGALLVLAASQFLPAGNPFREDVRASGGSLLWLALALVPVAGYALVIRRVRARTMPLPPRAPRPQGLVLIADDAALTRDTEAALWEEGTARDGVSVGWRDEGGDLVGHARVRLEGDVADLHLLWVSRGARGQGIGGRLLAQIGEEARLRGARTLIADVGSAATAGYLSRHGFRPYAAVEGSRFHMRKALA